ncbi:hypothetical protein ACQKDB_16085 [Planococcus kocurii]|uniref:hypothetical protein n=1 Tax=Planococcus kocurii TaxID=1374 RepID=UPI003D013BC8
MPEAKKKTTAKKKTYVTVQAFRDLEDNEYIYQVGEVYPRNGNESVKSERVEKLLSKENAQGKPVIKEA